MKPIFSYENNFKFHKMRFALLFLSLLFISLESIAQTTLVKVIFTVEDFDTRKGMPGALVQVRQTASTQPTLADGKITFNNVPVGEIEYFIMKEGYQFETGRVNVSTEEKTNIFRIPISKIDDKKILVTGEVTDSEGRDLKDAWVEVKIADQVRTVMSDESGNYSLDISPSKKFPTSTMRIEVKKGDCKKTETVEIPITNVVYKDIKLGCDNLEIKEDKKATEATSSNKDCDKNSMPYILENESVKIEFCQCYYYSNKVTCPLWVKNKTTTPYYLYIAGDNKNRIILDYGKDYSGTNSILMSSSSGTSCCAYSSIPATKNGVPASITFDNVKTQSKFLESLEISTGFGVKSFSDVPLVHSTPPQK